jgi:hypothetical protein
VQITHVSVARTLGEQHRKQRKMLNPVFAISHLREMGEYSFLVFALINLAPVPIFYDVVYKVRAQISHWFSLLDGKLGISFGTQLQIKSRKGHKK